MYKLTNSDKVINLEKGMIVQSGDEGLNSTWDEYQEWLKKGNKPLPADPSEPPRDLAKEIDLMKVEIAELKAKK